MTPAEAHMVAVLGLLAVLGWARSQRFRWQRDMWKARADRAEAEWATWRDRACGRSPGSVADRAS